MKSDSITVTGSGLFATQQHIYGGAATIIKLFAMRYRCSRVLLLVA